MEEFLTLLGAAVCGVVGLVVALKSATTWGWPIPGKEGRSGDGNEGRGDSGGWFNLDVGGDGGGCGGCGGCGG